MELPLQQAEKEIYAFVAEGFNPCFNGTTSATSFALKTSTINLLFQSLF